MGSSRHENRMSPGVSVIICCHNSSTRLPETLRHLAAQQVPDNLPWEIVVVDNASTDETAAIALRNWPGTAPLRVVPEPQPGLNHARRRGILEARHEIISLIDDDNWVAADWIRRVQSIFAANPGVGACGGKSEAVTEIDPPAWFENIKGFYAIGSQHRKNGDVTDAPGTLLWGAGLNLRAAAFHELLARHFEFSVQDRKGAQLSTGGDTETCFALRASGWRLWYDDALLLRHFVPRERLRWDYALRLMQGMGRASVLFDLYLSALGCPPFDAYPAWKKTWLFQLLKVLRQWATVVLFHPWDCLLEPEGSSSALTFATIRGRLAMLWSMRGRYQELRTLIAGSAWAKPPGKKPA